ncbi:PREDICTED: transcription repressor OFP15-like [Camelina sativa]|uniref:Transcription repressor n=1 Tax=Camelina sativa TaxID=90675 RepID=A0ABM0ZJY8_CAMSA|nr:PREDICTED: transcription repressor OFP15-like [Camelina sativa]
MKLPFLNKNNSHSSSWPWPSCNQEPKTMSFRATITFTNPIHDQEDDELDFEPPEISDSVESVIKGLRSSERLIFESKGETNSILEEATSKREEDKEEEDGFVLFSLESNDPYTDFKRSMEEMVEAHALHHDWKSLETLLLQFLKVNAKASHRYIFAAFVDLLVNLALHTKKPIIDNDISKDDSVSASRAAAAAAGEASTSCCNSMTLGESPSSPLSFYTSCSSSSSSDETSSTSVRFLPLSSLLEMDEKTKDILVYTA